MEGRQFSTSRDVVIYVGEVLDRYSADALRYYLTAAGPETQDTDFTWAEFVRRNNDELARELGQSRQPRADERVPELRRGPRRRARSPTTTRAVLADVEAGFGPIGQLIEQARFKAALGEAMQLATSVNRYVSEQAPWVALESDPARAATILHVALRCIDSLKVLFTPFLPFSSQRLHELLGHEGWLAGPLEIREVTEPDGSSHAILGGDYASWIGAWAPSALPAGQALQAPEPLFPKLDPVRRRRRRARAAGGARSRRMIDTHAHLDAVSDAPSDVLERARSVGVTRVVTIGTGIESCRRALEIAESETGVVAALGIDPHRAATSEAGRVDELRELLAHPKAVAVGETGLDGHHGADTLREQRVLFDAQLALADDLDLPIVIHSREASAETAAALAPFEGTVVLHCFSEPELLETALERALLRLVRRQRHLSEGRRPARGRSSCARRSAARRDR